MDNGIKSMFLGMVSSLLLMPGVLHAQEAVAEAKETGYTYGHVVLGDMDVVQLAESHREVGKDILIDATPQMIEECGVNGSFKSAVNCFLIRTKEHVILVDTGMNGEKLAGNLERMKVKPAEVDIILLTHMHPDHIGGMDQVRFENATVYIPKKEYEHWVDREMIEKIDAVNGKLKLPDMVAWTYKKQIKLFEPGALTGKQEELISGVTPIAAYGHTPGHTMYLLNSGGQKLFIWGDLVHAADIQLKYPEVAVTYDADPEEAVKSRKAVLDYVEKEKIDVAGMHIYGAGIISADGMQQLRDK